MIGARSRAGGSTARLIAGSALAGGARGFLVGGGGQGKVVEHRNVRCGTSHAVGSGWSGRGRVGKTLWVGTRMMRAVLVMSALLHS